MQPTGQEVLKLLRAFTVAYLEVGQCLSVNCVSGSGYRHDKKNETSSKYTARKQFGVISMRRIPLHFALKV